MSRPTRWFEDFSAGDVARFGAAEMTEAAIIGFASAYDPQPFHIDPEAAKSSVFGGLIASGWHTGSVVMRLLVDHFISPESGLGSPGIDELRWVKPVRPGDVISVRLTVLETIPSRSKPDRGVLRTFTEVLNQHDEVVMTVRAINLIRRRPAG